MLRALQRFLALATALGALSGPVLAGSGKVVVELFTSQGCSSCLPADALLRELSRRDDVIALSMHVDYWNYLGWTDPFSSPEATQRQSDYRANLGLRYVYTPQMVIGGAAQTVGSGRAEVLRAIEAARSRPVIEVSMVPAGTGGAVIRIGTGIASGPATVWLFGFDAEHSTKVRSGENGGVTLVNTNVVRVMRPIGRWTGAATELRVNPAEMEGRDGCAVVVQQGTGGPILGAASLRLSRGGL